jgi:hypothetical protein
MSQSQVRIACIPRFEKKYEIWRTILDAMPLYRVSGKGPYERAFYIGFAVIIALFLGLSFISPRYGENISGNGLAWVAAAIVVASIVFFLFLDFMQDGWRWKVGYRLEFSGGRLIQRGRGEEAVEIPVGEIESLREGHGCLIVEGGKKEIVIPVEISDFSSLKRELSAYGAVTPLKKAESPLFLSVGLAIAVWVLLALLFISYRRGVIDFTSAAWVLLPAEAILLLLRSRTSRLPIVVVLYLNTITLIVTWFVFHPLPAIF